MAAVHHTLLAVALLAACAVLATADRPSWERPTCCMDPNGAPIPIRRIHKNKLVFAVIGDWGRTGGNLSTVRRENGGYDSGPDYWCSDPSHGFADDDVTGGMDQRMCAQAMDTACGRAGCSFVINTGDNFYECGIDDPRRWKTDFTDIYQTSSTPHIKNLPWYGVIGNHDIVAKGSVEAQIAYNMNNSRWFLNRTYAFEVHNADSSLRLRFGAINTNPFVTKYAKANYKYNTSEFRAFASPANITSQLNYLRDVLASSKAHHDFVIGHHPVFGAISANGYNATALYSADASSTDLGRKDASGGASWASLVSILRQFNPTAYMNGHDHTLALAKDALNQSASTLYLTSGAGSLPDDACKSAVYRSNLLFDALVNNATAVAECGAGVGPDFSAAANTTYPPSLVGFSIITVTSSSVKIDIYSSQAGVPHLLYTITRNTRHSHKHSDATRLDRGCSC